MKRAPLMVLGLAFSLLLSSCIRQEGAISINPDASITGTVVLGIDRQLAASLGISSLNDALKNQESQGASTEGCVELKSEETSTEYAFTCNYKNSKVISGDMTSNVQNNKIVFTFEANADASESSMNLGKLLLIVQFPGAIETVKENRPGIVQKQNDGRIKIEGYATEPISVQITSSCGSSCSSDPVELSKSFNSAPSNFGGMIRTDTVMRKANSPFKIKNTIQIPFGRTLIVEPGVEIVADLGASTELLDRSLFFNQGRLIFAGQENGRIRITGNPYVIVRNSGSTSSSITEARFTEFLGAEYLTYSYDANSAGQFLLSDSLIKGIRNDWQIYYPKNVFFVERNVFLDSAGLYILAASPEGSTLPSIYVKHNVFFGVPIDFKSKAPSGCWISARATYQTKIIVENNDFSQVPQKAICIGSEPNIAVDASLNFWGTTNVNEIENRIFDSNDDLAASSKIILGKPLEQSPLITEPQLGALGIYASSVKREADAPAVKPKAPAKKPQAVTKKRITCVKGKAKLKVIGNNPKCPTGYRIG